MRYLYFGIWKVNSFITTKERKNDKNHRYIHTSFFIAVMFWLNLMSLIYTYIGVYRDWRLPLEPKYGIPVTFSFYLVLLLIIRFYYRGKDSGIMKEMELISKVRRNIIIGLSFIYIVASFTIFYYLIDLGHDVNINR